MDDGNILNYSFDFFFIVDKQGVKAALEILACEAITPTIKLQLLIMKIFKISFIIPTRIAFS